MQIKRDKQTDKNDETDKNGFMLLCSIRIRLFFQFICPPYHIYSAEGRIKNPAELAEASIRRTRVIRVPCITFSCV
jgi:hypothetical protein